MKRRACREWYGARSGEREPYLKTVIPEGTVLVADEHVPDARGFACLPERYEELEAALVPEETCSADKYNGYYFVFLLAGLGKSLKRVPLR